MRFAEKVVNAWLHIWMYLEHVTIQHIALCFTFTSYISSSGKTVLKCLIEVKS